MASRSEGARPLGGAGEGRVSRRGVSLALGGGEAAQRAGLPAEELVLRAETPSGLPGEVELPGGGVHALRLSGLDGGGLRACLACGHEELYTQKDFPRGPGIAVVVVAAVLAPFTNYLSLVAAAVVDGLLHRFAPDVVVCYVCQSRHRGFAQEPRHPRFDREIDERLRYGERAVMGKPMRPGGTANAPEPEH